MTKQGRLPIAIRIEPAGESEHPTELNPGPQEGNLLSAWTLRGDIHKMKYIVLFRPALVGISGR